jgi:hypothetical protein
MARHRFRLQPTKNTTNAGWGSEHQKARKAAAARHNPHDPCTRCRQPLGPMGRWLHYDHTDDRLGYLGFAHARCNSVAGARRGAQVVNARQRARRSVRRAQSRAW